MIGAASDDTTVEASRYSPNLLEFHRKDSRGKEIVATPLKP